MLVQFVDGLVDVGAAVVGRVVDVGAVDVEVGAVVVDGVVNVVAV